jgi:aminoglycoside phosphotransferase family enzyme
MPHDARAIPLASKIAFLSLGSSYLGPVHRVERLETHLSWVFLAGNFAYKLKKPVKTDVLDFRSLASRRFFCEEELRLNRRLAKSVYLGVVPLTLEPGRQLRLGGDGPAHEWLIKMRRLPAWLMLDVAILGRGALDQADRIVRTLTRFYAALPAEHMAPAHYRARFQLQIEADRAELGAPLYRLPCALIGSLCSGQTAALNALGDQLDERLASGRLVEGHGDLRPEHVCLLPQVAIIDCLEFSRALRIIDKADEVGYLALECERQGAAPLGEAILASYRHGAGDPCSAALLHFYQSCRASKRAVLAARHLREKKYRFSAHWRRTASSWLALAHAHMNACRASMAAAGHGASTLWLARTAGQ